MDYLEITQISSRHNFTYTESTREWFLGNERSVKEWRRLASLRFYQDPNLLPTSTLPVIQIENFQGEGAWFDEHYTLPEGRLLDLFSIVLYDFVSSRLKALFEEAAVEAYFTEVAVTIKGELYPEPYYLLCPRDMLPVFDEENSLFTIETDTSGKLKIKSVEHYVLLNNEIPENQKLFYMYINGKSNPLMLRSDIVEKMKNSGMTGIKYTPVDEMRSI